MATSTSSISGLASGLDTASLVSQLMQIEAQPQNLLKTRLSTTQSTANAYRSVNTRFDALRTAAEALTASSLAAARSATSTDTSVTATAGASAVSGDSISFSVTNLASTQVQLSTSTWETADAPIGVKEPQWPIQVTDASGIKIGDPIKLPDKPNPTLLDAVKAINASGYGIRATVVQTGTKQFQLQVTSTSSGGAGARRLVGAGETTSGAFFKDTSPALDAELYLGPDMSAHSATNTFTNLLPGVSVTVSKQSAATTVTVGSDPNGVADKVQKLVDAANAALTEIDNQTATSSTSKSALTGDYAVSSLTGQVLTGFSDTVGSGLEKSSPASIGLATNRDGQVTFDRTKFLAAYAADPVGVTRKLAGGDAVKDAGGKVTSPAVTGVAQRLAALAKAATDKTTGSLTTLANGQDTRAKDLTKQIADWDTRLTARQATLTAQFNAMETALSTLKNQSSWLSQQLNSLSTSSSSK